MAEPAGALVCTAPSRSARIAAASLQSVPPEKSPRTTPLAAGPAGGSAGARPSAPASRAAAKAASSRVGARSTPSTGSTPPPTMQATAGVPQSASARSTRSATAGEGGLETHRITSVPSSAARRAMASSAVIAPTSSLRSRPPVP